MPHFTPTECDTGRRTSGVRTRQSRILLIDDYDDARAVVREALEDVGYVVTEASNGQQALNFLVSRAQEDVDLIIVDLQMPVMDGWRFIELLRCYVRLSTIPIVIVTAAQDPHLERITHRAVVGCLRAPYEVTALVDMVDQSLNRTAAGSGPATQ
jgi:CheY-like chemotaxis protein